MGGPGSQRNKPHKAGRRAGLSAREKHRNKRDLPHRSSIKSSYIRQGRADRLNASKQQRERKRAQILEAKRGNFAPRLVCVLPLSNDVDLTGFWQNLIGATEITLNAIQEHRNGGNEDDVMQHAGVHDDSYPVFTTVAIPERQKMRFAFVPPPKDRSDPFAIIEIARLAEIILFVLPGSSTDTAAMIDADGEMALTIFRAMGMPYVMASVQLNSHRNTGSARNPAASLKDRSAAKKKAIECFSQYVGGEHKFMNAETRADFQQILRHLADAPLVTPHWRTLRPQIVPDSAEFIPTSKAENSNVKNLDQLSSNGRLVLYGYVRNQSLSAAQVVHVCGSGDFQIHSIEGVDEPVVANAKHLVQSKNKLAVSNACSMDIDKGVKSPNGCYPVLAAVPPEERESLQRENEVNPLDGEQTWPTEEELLEASSKQKSSKMARRRLPKGTSEYQAAWIVDEDGSDFEDVDAMSDDELEHREHGKITGNGIENDSQSLPDLELLDGDGTGTEFDGMDYEEEADIQEDKYKAEADAERARRHAEDDVQYPDEVDVPFDVPARQRFARYRGLKSFRTSPWDPKEDLPSDYAKVFAFENYKKAFKRAKELMASPPLAGVSVPTGTYVRLILDNVPSAVGFRVVDRVLASSSTGNAPLLSVFGLMQHETKLSVVNFSVQKKSDYKNPIANKEELLFVTGIRSFTACPILSTDEYGADKFKMERFLHEGRQTIATVYAPIMFPPAPLLAFKSISGAKPVLAASGTLRDCNPDRVILKKIVLTGYPMRQHKSKAVVRFMFHNPDDIRWFRPVELYTKQGRRGRIREPVGTHGTMKCIFDGPISQQDAICMSLYKRVYPKWPRDLTFA